MSPLQRRREPSTTTTTSCRDQVGIEKQQFFGVKKCLSLTRQANVNGCCCGCGCGCPTTYNNTLVAKGEFGQGLIFSWQKTLSDNFFLNFANILQSGPQKLWLWWCCCFDFGGDSLTFFWCTSAALKLNAKRRCNFVTYNLVTIHWCMIFDSVIRNRP